jgi:dipeptidyl-peptidase-4
MFARIRNKDQREGEPDWIYSHELGLNSAYWWSPDSSSIAWLETDDRAVDRYSLRQSNGNERFLAYPKHGGVIPTVQLFVRNISDGLPRSINLGHNPDIYIPLVMWLPDGKHLAIERLDRSQKTLDLLISNAATGKSRIVLTERDAYWINLSNALYFFKGSSRFLWSSERSGYRHLYLYDLSGRLLTQITQGSWEVTSLDNVDEALGVVYFTATEESPLVRQLYRASLDGSASTRLSNQSGTHEVVFSPHGEVYLDTWSSHSTSAHIELLRTDGSMISRLNSNLPDDFAAIQLSLPSFFTVTTHMELGLNAWIIKPRDFDPAHHYPVILYVAGGPGEQIVRDMWGGDISLWFSLMAQKGYIVFAIDNRGSAGHGHLFEEPIHLRLSAAEMSDQRDGVQYLRSQPWVDQSRIGICGWGYGGFLVIHGMLDRPLLFKAGFAGSPITDWHLYDAAFAERYLGDPVRNQDGWLSSSPLENAKNLKAPLLLAQAMLDERIHTEHSLMLLDELLANGKYADLLLFPDRQDLFVDYDTRLILFQRLTDFFLKNL